MLNGISKYLYIVLYDQYKFYDYVITFLYCWGTAAMMSTNRGWLSRPYLLETLLLILKKYNNEIYISCLFIKIELEFSPYRLFIPKIETDPYLGSGLDAGLVLSVYVQGPWL